jgi:ferredoxin
VTLVDHLSRISPPHWDYAVNTIGRDTHRIDQSALRIWFSFFPVELCQALEYLAKTGQEGALADGFNLKGRWRLADQVDTSHTFLYGHRYWPQVKRTVMSVQKASSWPDGVTDLIQQVADAASRTAGVDRDQLLSMSAVALMMLRQVGAEAFAASKGTVQLLPKAHAYSPRQILDSREGGAIAANFFGSPWKTRWWVRFSENEPGAHFKVIKGQTLAEAWRASSAPSPVQCTADACNGTCWVGILHGADRIEAVDDREEGQRLLEFGYEMTGAPHPVIRLACQARPNGALTIVIPPWSGAIGSLRRRSS